MRLFWSLREHRPAGRSAGRVLRRLLFYQLPARQSELDCSWSAGKHLNHPANLVVAADHRIEFACSVPVGQIAPVFFEGLIGTLRDSWPVTR